MAADSPPPARGLTAIRRLSLAATLATGLLLVVGSLVSATGAGLACPDWPLCHGRLIPPLDRLVLIEYGHRLLASAVGLMILGLAVLAWRHLGRHRPLRRLIAGALGLLAVQVGLGGATVLSRLIPAVVGTHLLVAMSFLAVLVAFTARARWETAQDAIPAPPDGLRRLAHLAVAATLVQIGVGGYTSALGAGLACPDVPLCRGSVLPALELPVLLQMGHRLTAVVVTVLVALAGARARGTPDRVTRAAAGAAVLLVGGQVLLGALNVWTRLAMPVQIAHLAGAAALLSSLVVLLVRVRLGARDPRPASVEAPAPAALRARVGDYVALMKPRIIVLLLVTTVTAMVVAAGGWFGWTLAIVTLLGGTLAAGAANAINCYWDRDIDAVMGRTRHRPIPQRRVAPGRALAFGVALAVAAVLVLGLAVNWLSAGLALAGILYYVGIYTIWLKRTTPHNIVIGGAAGAIPPLVGWAAVTNEIGLPAIVLFAIVFLWTPPHFWALAVCRSDDYRAARIPMLPVVRGTGETVRQIVLYTAALVAASLVLAGVGGLGRIYLASAVALALPLVVLVGRMARQVTPRTAWVLFEYSILYLGLLFVSMALDRLLA